MTNTPGSGYVMQINVNPEGGVPKYRTDSAEVTINGVRGDKQRDRRFHGGPSRAVSLYAYELIQALQSEGHPIEPGSTGENLTLHGIDWSALHIGDQLVIGERVCIEITDYAAPCQNIAQSFLKRNFARVSHKVHPGWSRLYARVLVEGTIREGDRVDWDVSF